MNASVFKWRAFLGVRRHNHSLAEGALQCRSLTAIFNDAAIYIAGSYSSESTADVAVVMDVKHCFVLFVDIRVSIVVSVIAVLKISFIECPSVVHGNSNYDDIPIGVHGGLPRG